MIDYYSHFAVLDVLRARLDQSIAAGELKDKRAVNTADFLKSDYSYAILGSVIDHLMEHDRSSDVELDLLTEALNLWLELTKFINEFRNARRQIERVSLSSSSVTALVDFNAARMTLASLIPRYDLLTAKLQSFRWKLQPLSHLTAHPQSTNQHVRDWPWRDVVLSRRTGAFAANIFQLARNEGTSAALSFAVGVLASYIGNSVGSPYLVNVVGGPRRSHPYRDRVGSYSIGAWISEVPLAIKLSHDRTRNLPSIGSPNSPSLPPWLEELIRKALDLTYQNRGPHLLPNINSSYKQLMKHWQLLHAFIPIFPPQPIDVKLRTRINAGLKPKDYDRPDPGTGGSSGGGPAPGPAGNIFDPGPGSTPWFSQSNDDIADWIREVSLDIIFAPLFLIRLGFYLGRGKSHGDPKPTSTFQAASALSTPLTASEAAAILGSTDILIAVDELFYLDAALHQLSQHCLKIMKLVGLLYPTAVELPEVQFSQFLVLPPKVLISNWPTRKILNPDLFLSIPTSAVEKPTITPSAFSPGEKPIAFLTKGIGTGASAENFGFNLLVKEIIQSTTSEIHSENRNLDGDRGLDQLCWALKDGTSIDVDPVKTNVLDYNDI